MQSHAATRPTPLCDWRGAYHCTRRANGYAFAWHVPFVVVWRVCTYCARWIFEWRWDTVSSLAQPNGEHVPERRVRQWESRNKRT